jgi:PAS domain S-box-containing protein
MVTPICDAAGRPERLLCISRDVTSCHEAEREREAAVELLHHVNAVHTLRAMVAGAVAFFKRQSGCDAVAIRLKEGEDYPHYEALGFLEDFLQAEQSLLVRDGAGAVLRDRDGHPILEGMCGHVINGRGDAFQPFFTLGGSFWTNSTSRWADCTTQVKEHCRLRNHCNAAGYESVALIPLRADGQCLGLLQLCDRRQARFTPELIAAWERLADHLAVAIAKSRVEEALRASEERLRLAIESASLGTWDYDVVADKLNWSERTKAAFGLPPDAEVDFATFIGRLHPEDRHILLRLKEQTGTPGESREFQAEYRSVWPDGTERALLATGKTFFGLIAGRPSVVRCVGTLRDITDQKQAEALNVKLVEELRQSQKMQAIGQLAGGTAHNFNNLLLAIAGHVEIMADALTKSTASDNQKICLHSVGQLRKAVDIGTGLTRRLLAFCRRQPLRPVLLDPDQAIAGMVEMLRDVLGPKITLELNSSGDVGYLYTDLDQIQQAIVNLVLNGRDAMPEGGTLAIRTGRRTLAEAAAVQRGVSPGSFVCVSVTDTGSGMDERTRKRLFEPFFTTKPLGQGTGLGLATVYGFVKQAGGSIDVESELGVGTTFTLLLPAFSEGPAGQDFSTARRPKMADQTVLFCDDNELIRPMIGQYLSAAGYAVLEAEDAEKALALAQAHAGPIHLLVTDIQLPGISGVELAKRLRGLRPETKCILITGHPDYLPDPETTAKLEATLLCKPFQLPDLLRLVGECVEA